MRQSLIWIGVGLLLLGGCTTLEAVMWRECLSHHSFFYCAMLIL
jgi:hypothetical protein